MACQAHAVACIPCQAHVLERHYSQTNYHKSFQAPIGWFIKRLLGAFVKAVSRHALSSTCHGMSSRCCGMPCAHVLACQAVSWRALSSQCRGMPCRGMSSPCQGMPCQADVVPCQAVVVACLVPTFWHVKPYRGIPCQAHVLACMPCQAHLVACAASTIFFYVVSKIPIAPNCFPSASKCPSPKGPRALEP